MRILRFSLRATGKDKIIKRNEHISGTLKVDGVGQKVRQARPRWYGYVKHVGMWAVEGGGEAVSGKKEIGEDQRGGIWTW